MYILSKSAILTRRRVQNIRSVGHFEPVLTDETVVQKSCKFLWLGPQGLGSEEEEEEEEEEVSLRIEKVIKKVRINGKSHSYFTALCISWFGRRRRRGFPPNRKSYPKKSVSMVNPTPILPRSVFLGSEEEEEEVSLRIEKVIKKVRINGKSHSYFTALCISNKRKGTPASILNLSFQARSLSKMHAHRHIPAQTRLEITLSGTSYILHV